MKIKKFYELILLILCFDMICGNLFVDDSIKYALFDDFKKNVKAGNFAIGNVEGLKVDVNDGIATLTTTDIWHGWHHASLGQAPPTSSLNSYISFLDLSTIKFKIKSNQITTSEIKVYLEIRNGGFGLDRKLIDLGYNEILDWTEIEISVKSFRSLKMSMAFAISLNGGQLDRTMQIKDIEFLNDNGGNANVLAKIEWPKETGTDTPPEPPMEIGTKIKKNGIELTLEWSDEFIQSDILPDKTKWGYDIGDGVQDNTDGTNPHTGGWGNGEAQWYTANNENNAFVSDGTLKIRAIRESTGNKNWSSSRMVTRNLKEFKYGYFEFRVKIPEYQGIWPAIWMLRHDIYDPNGTPWPTCGEIDILETSFSIWGRGRIYGTLHCDAGHSGGPVYSKGLQISEIEQKWHLYSLYWTPNSMLWYYDDQLVGKYVPRNLNNDVWPFQHDFYLIMNLAMGGTLGGDIPEDLNEATMEIDYVRYFSAVGEGNEGDNGPGNKEDEPIPVNFEVDESIRKPIGFIATDKGEGRIDVVWGNDASILADLYAVMVDGEIVKIVGGPSVNTVSVNNSGKHTFGVATIKNGKMSLPTTAELDINL